MHAYLRLFSMAETIVNDSINISPVYNKLFLFDKMCIRDHNLVDQCNLLNKLCEFTRPMCYA